MAEGKGQTEPALRRRLRADQRQAALTGSGTALVLGFVLIATAAAYVLGQRGLLAERVWQMALAAGLAVVVAKIALDLTLPVTDPWRLRRVLGEAFGPQMRQEGEVSRLARLVIEFRVRLAEAAAKAGRGRQRELAGVMLALDGWIDSLVMLAQDVAQHRGEARFQQGLARAARERRDEIGSRLTGAHETAAVALGGLSAQIESAEGYARRVEAAQLVLEGSIAAFGAVSGQLAQALTGGPLPDSAALLRQIDAERARIARQLAPAALDAPLAE